MGSRNVRLPWGFKDDVFTCCSVSWEKVSLRTAEDREVRWTSSSSLSLWIFAEKTSPKVSGRPTVRMELGRVLLSVSSTGTKAPLPPPTTNCSNSRQMAYNVTLTDPSYFIAPGKWPWNMTLHIISHQQCCRSTLAEHNNNNRYYIKCPWRVNLFGEAERITQVSCIVS